MRRAIKGEGPAPEKRAEDIVTGPPVRLLLLSPPVPILPHLLLQVPPRQKSKGKRIDKKKRHDKPREFKEGGKSIRFITFNGWCGSQRK